MVCKCCVCSNYAHRNDNLSFHGFPKNPEIRALWLKALKIEDKQSKKYLAVCSKHFKDADFNSSITGPRKLHPNAVPFLAENSTNSPNQNFVDSSIVITEEILLSTAKPKIEVMKRLDEQNGSIMSERKLEPNTANSVNRNVVQNCINVPPSSGKGGGSHIIRYIGDLSTHHFSTPEQTEYNVKMIKHLFEKKQKKVKLLGKQNNTLRKRIADLVELVNELQEQVELLNKQKSIGPPKKKLKITLLKPNQDENT